MKKAWTEFYEYLKEEADILWGSFKHFFVSSLTLLYDLMYTLFSVPHKALVLFVANPIKAGFGKLIAWISCL